MGPLYTSVYTGAPYSRTPPLASAVSVCLLHRSVVGSTHQTIPCSPPVGSLETDPETGAHPDTREMNITHYILHVLPIVPVSC